MTITFMGFHQPLDGYGYATMQIAEALQAIEPGTSIVNMDGGSDNPYDTEQHWHVEGTAVALCTPDWLPQIGADHLVSYTMFEATKLPAGWTDKINRYAEMCLVPCRWCKEVFHANGVTVPIEVVPWGVNPQDYYPLARPAQRSPFQFLWSGTPDMRKGWDVAYLAFLQAFGASPRVHLTLHFRQAPPFPLRFGDPNVSTAIGLFDRPALREMLRNADAFVFPSRGEGWGSPPREAAATRLPVIATDFGGLAEDIRSWALPLRWDGTSKAQYGFWDDIGEWVEPEIGHCAELMTWIVEHPRLAYEYGRFAQEWIALNLRWQRTARMLLEIGD